MVRKLLKYFAVSSFPLGCSCCDVAVSLAGAGSLQNYDVVVVMGIV